jgi:hypothetical protein
MTEAIDHAGPDRWRWTLRIPDPVPHGSGLSNPERRDLWPRQTRRVPFAHTRCYSAHTVSSTTERWRI